MSHGVQCFSSFGCKNSPTSELRIIDFGIAKTQRKLAELEKETGMNSKDFYRQFQEGNLGDDIRFIRWAGECETLERLKDDYRHLQELALCS